MRMIYYINLHSQNDFQNTRSNLLVLNQAQIGMEAAIRVVQSRLRYQKCLKRMILPNRFVIRQLPQTNHRALQLWGAARTVFFSVLQVRFSSCIFIIKHFKICSSFFFFSSSSPDAPFLAYHPPQCLSWELPILISACFDNVTGQGYFCVHLLFLSPICMLFFSSS